MAPKIYVTRRETFCASHRLNRPDFTEDENQRLFGKCNYPNGHGHNYIVEVTIASGVDKQTGIVMNTDTLKRAITDILDTMDHKNLDMDIPYFKDIVSTGENVTIFIWKELSKKLPPNFLHKIRIRETEKNSFVYKGEEI